MAKGKHSKAGAPSAEARNGTAVMDPHEEVETARRESEAALARFEGGMPGPVALEEAPTAEQLEYAFTQWGPVAEAQEALRAVIGDPEPADREPKTGKEDDGPIGEPDTDGGPEARLESLGEDDEEVGDDDEEIEVDEEGEDEEE